MAYLEDIKALLGAPGPGVADPESWSRFEGHGCREQSVGVDTYGLFLGNEVYLLACPAHCDPAAVWPVNQN